MNWDNPRAEIIYKEYMLQKDGSIILDNFQRGVSQSEYLGIGAMLGLDIFTEPGIAKVEKALTHNDDAYEGTTIGAKVFSLTKDSAGYMWAKDEDGHVYRTHSASYSGFEANTPTSHAAGGGIIYWKGYVFDFKGNTTNAINVFKVSNTTWYEGVLGINFDTVPTATGKYVPYIGDNDKLYFAYGNTINSISEVAGETFDHSDSDTYTVNIYGGTPALDLPTNWNIVNLSEQDGYMVISANNPTDNKSGFFFWDKVSTSFNYYLLTGTNDIKTHISVNSLTYFITADGKINVTNGKVSQVVGQLPYSMFGTNAMSVNYPQSIMYFNGKVYLAVGSSTYTSGFAAGIFTFEPNGFNPVSVTCQNVYSYEYVASTTAGVLFAYSDVIFLASFHSYHGSTNYYEIARYIGPSSQSASTPSNYVPYFVSQFYSVGSPNNKKTFRGVEFQLAQPQAYALKFYYRTATNGSWTLHTTYPSGSVQSHYGSSIPAVEGIQFKVELHSSAKLKYIRIA